MPSAGGRTAWRRAGRRIALAGLAGLGGAALIVLRSTDWLASLGGRPEGERLARMQRSPQWANGHFRNTVATQTLKARDLPATVRMQVTGKEVRYPTHPIPVVELSREAFAILPASGLRLTWLGHATALLEIDGARVLTDPIWSERVSPSTLAGPRRFFPPPLPLEDLPPLDAVVVSHDHYDHLDMATIRALSASGAAFYVPLGVGAHLERWNVPAERIHEFDWNESARVGPLTLTLAAARHFSGRGFRNRNGTLWGSWVLAGPRHRVFYSGDTGDFDGFRSIGETYGPFDTTLMSAGAYSPAWPAVHIFPEELVGAHQALRGGLLIPVHWGTFNLAFHDWNDPARRISAEAARLGVAVALPRPGQAIEPSSPPPDDPWWRTP
jgi:L-ascorbate metabolism protein UlaG (beta-lactamase superfamily)